MVLLSSTAQHHCESGCFFMPIYLDEQTRPVLESIIKKWIELHPKDFVAERIQKSLASDQARLDSISQCQHTTARYVGTKTCCAKCGSFYEPGMGEKWSLEKTE
jgi:hypothetical protein